MAQKVSDIKGAAFGPDGEPLSYANVLLHRAADSTLVKLALSDEEGQYNFQSVPAASYWLEVSYVGLPGATSDVFELSGESVFTVPEIRIEAVANELSEVTVRASRPLLEMKPGKMVFNVEGSTNAVGSDALELLRKAPGVVVDNNENIMLLGKNGVRIYIDGKPSPLSSTDLAALLKSMQATEIDAIEIITNPSAKYEAEGSGGIINIKLKKDKKLGANANLNLGFARGWRTQYNGTLSSNYRNKKVNVFGNYSYFNGGNRNPLSIYREQLGQAFDQRGESNGNWESHNFKTGADFFLDKKSTLGFLVNGNLSNFESFNESETPFWLLSEGEVERVLVANADSKGKRQNLNFNINYLFDNGKGVSWNIDADYGRFENQTTMDQPNFYYDASISEILEERIYHSNTPTDIDIYTFKTDHERPLLNGKFSTGIKTALVRTDNLFRWYNVVNGEREIDTNRSNEFTYSEHVNAAYINYSRGFDKWNVQFGLRAEHTHSEGDLERFDSSIESPEDHVERNYLDLFPSAGITYQLNAKNSFQLSYSRRINRPSYQDLNPFEDKLDELTFQKGNPFLQPEYANSIQLTHSYNYFLNTTIGFSHTRDMMARLTDTIGTQGSFLTWLNLADQYAYSLGVSGAIPIKKWWNSYTNLTAVHTQNKADYGNNKTVDLKVSTFNIYSQHTFSLPDDFALELSGWYNSPAIWGGTFKMESQWSLDAGLRKKIWGGRGSLKLSVSDIFKTTNWSGVSRFGVLYLRATGGWDSRRVRLGFSYLFGNTQVKKTRRRKAGLDAENRRIKSGN